jgi:hypothetical protein
LFDGFLFDSKREAKRYAELKLMERAGKIRNFKRQVPYELIPVQKDENGKVIERAVKYIADFTYYERDEAGNEKLIVEDAKGMQTDVYKIKRKLMLYVHGIRVREV